MYGNLNKHKVLTAMRKIASEHNDDFSIKMTYNQIIQEAKISLKSLETAIYSLSLEQYVKYLAKNGIEEISLFHKGANASLTKFFKEKNDKIFWNFFSQCILLFCNLGIAWAAIYALAKDKSIDEKLREDVKSLKEQQSTLTQQIMKLGIKTDTIEYLMHYQKNLLLDTSKALPPRK